MAVYVDELRATPKTERWRHAQACHLMADTDVELEKFARQIGLSRRWKDGDHYDLTPAARHRAVVAGAQATTARKLVGLRKAKKHEHPQ